MSALALTISDIPIHQDTKGRYCLNDLHKASGNHQKHRPKYWLENQQTKELIAELSEGGIPPIYTKQQLGTFVAKELVYAYAMWISPAFSLKVIRTFDALVTGQLQPALPPPDYAVLQSKYITLLESENNRLKASTPLPEPPPSGARRRWTAEEDAVLLEKRRLGHGSRRIGRVLNRSSDGVAHRIRRLAEQQQGGAL